jgi:hypothetical protein
MTHDGIDVYVYFASRNRLYDQSDCLCGLVIRVPGYRSRDPGSISGAARFYEK